MEWCTACIFIIYLFTIKNKNMSITLMYIYKFYLSRQVSQIHFAKFFLANVINMLSTILLLLVIIAFLVITIIQIKTYISANLPSRYPIL